MQASPMRETHKQRQLNYQLQQRGVGKTWREFLREQQAAGFSHVRLAILITSEYGVPVDAKTISNWLRQSAEVPP
jgi:hypothetical protein